MSDNIEKQVLEGELKVPYIYINENAPYIGDNDNWYVFDYEKMKYVDTGILAKVDEEKIVSDLRGEIQPQLDEIKEQVDTAEKIAKGAQQSKAYSTYKELIESINGLDSTEYKIGQNFYITQLNIPDVWVCYIAEEKQVYTYTTDEAFIEGLKNATGVQVGYYHLAALETQKVDLSNYVQASRKIAGFDLSKDIGASELGSVMAADYTFATAFAKNERFASNFAYNSTFYNALISNQSFISSLALYSTFQNTLGANLSFGARLGSNASLISVLAKDNTFGSVFAQNSTFAYSIVYNSRFAITLGSNGTFGSTLAADGAFGSAFAKNSNFGRDIFNNSSFYGAAESNYNFGLAFAKNNTFGSTFAYSNSYFASAFAKNSLFVSALATNSVFGSAFASNYYFLQEMRTNKLILPSCNTQDVGKVLAVTDGGYVAWVTLTP